VISEAAEIQSGGIPAEIAELERQGNDSSADNLHQASHKGAHAVSDDGIPPPVDPAYAFSQNVTDWCSVFGDMVDAHIKQASIKGKSLERFESAERAQIDTHCAELSNITGRRRVDDDADDSGMHVACNAMALSPEDAHHAAFASACTDVDDPMIRLEHAQHCLVLASDSPCDFAEKVKCGAAIPMSEADISFGSPTVNSPDVELHLNTMSTKRADTDTVALQSNACSTVDHTCGQLLATPSPARSNSMRSGLSGKISSELKLIQILGEEDDEHVRDFQNLTYDMFTQDTMPQVACESPAVPPTWCATHSSQAAIMKEQSAETQYDAAALEHRDALRRQKILIREAARYRDASLSFKASSDEAESSGDDGDK
jgi:hypothetical protein